MTKSNLQMSCFFSRFQKGTMFCEWRCDNTGNKSSCTGSRAFGFCTNRILDSRWFPCILLLSLTFSNSTLVTLWTPSFCACLTDLLKLVFLLNPARKEPHLFRSVCTGVSSPPPRTMYIRVTLHWAYLIILWLVHFGVSCTVVILTCFVMFGCFDNMCACIYCVFCCLYCVFCIVSFMYIYSYLFRVQ